MAEQTLRDAFEERRNEGFDDETIIEQMKKQGLSSADLDLPLSVAKKKGESRLFYGAEATKAMSRPRTVTPVAPAKPATLSEDAEKIARKRLSLQTGIPTPEAMLGLEGAYWTDAIPGRTPVPMPVAPTPVEPAEPVTLSEDVAPTVAKAGEEGQAVKRVGGVLAPIETAKMVAGAVSGLFGDPGAQAAREKAERAQPTIMAAKEATLENLERKKRRQKEMGLTMAEALVVDAAEDAYELGTGLASILGTALAGVPVPEGMETQMEPFKMGEQVGEAFLPSLIGGAVAVAEDPWVAARAPISTLLNLYPAAKAFTKLGTAAFPKAGVAVQSAIPQLVNRTEGFLASKMPGIWRTFLNAYETGSPEANVLWKQIKESATTIDNAFNEALPKIESAILGERRLPKPLPALRESVGKEMGLMTTSPGALEMMVEPGVTPPIVPGPRFGRAEVQTPKKVQGVPEAAARKAISESEAALLEAEREAGAKALEEMLARTEVKRVPAATVLGSQATKDLITSGKTFVADDSIPLVHRSQSPISIADIDAEIARAGKQSRGGRIKTAGFYAYEPDTNIIAQRGVEEVQRLDANFGKQKLEFEIPAGTQILDISDQPGVSARLSPDMLQELRDAGYQVIKGKDLVGPPEYIVIDNKLFGPKPRLVTPPAVPGPQPGMTPVPSTILPALVREVELPAYTTKRMNEALTQLTGQLEDVSKELSQNLRRVYRVDTGVIADEVAVQNIARNAAVDALKNDAVGAIIKKPEYVRVAAKAINRTPEKLEADLRLNPFGALTDDELTTVANALDDNPASSSWRAELNTPKNRDQLVKASLQRVQEGLKNAARESLLEKEALPFMEAITAGDETFAESVANVASKRNLNPEIVKRNKFTNYITSALDEEGNSTLLNAINELRRRIDAGEPLPNFIPSTRSQQLLEDMKGVLKSRPLNKNEFNTLSDQEKLAIQIDEKLRKYLDGMSPTPYTYSPTAQGLVTAPLVADAVASTSSDLLRGADYLLSTIPKRVALPFNLKAAFNNFVGNETVMAMAYGNMPGTTLPYNFAKQLLAQKKVKPSKAKGFVDVQDVRDVGAIPGKKPTLPSDFALQQFKLAGERIGLFNTDQIAKDVNNFERLQSGFFAKGQEKLESVFGPTTEIIGGLQSGADKMYKTYTGFKEFERGLKYLSKLDDGEFIQFATGQNTSQRLTRVGDGFELQNFSLGKAVGKPVDVTMGLDQPTQLPILTNEGYNALARYGKTVADSYFFDYGDVPVLLQKIRKAPVVGVGSPFFTWSYKATDLPFKQGLASATIRGPNRILSNSKSVNRLQAMDSAFVALRRAGLTALAKREQETSPELNTVMSYNPKDPGSKMFKSLGDPSVYAAMNLGQADPFGQALEVATIASNIASWGYENAVGQTTDKQLERIYNDPNSTTEEAFSAVAAKLRRDAIYKKETMPTALNLFGLGLTFFADKYYQVLKSQEQGNAFDYTKALMELYLPGMAKTAIAAVSDELQEGLMSSALEGYPIAESSLQYAVRNILGPGYATVNTPEQYKRFRNGVQKEMEAVIKKKQQSIKVKRKEKALSADIEKQEQTLELMEDLVNQALEEMDSYFLGGEKPIVPGAE